VVCHRNPMASDLRKKARTFENSEDSGFVAELVDLRFQLSSCAGRVVLSMAGTVRTGAIEDMD